MGLVRKGSFFDNQALDLLLWPYKVSFLIGLS